MQIKEMLEDRVAIQEDDHPDRVGGIHVPDMAKVKPNTGVIVKAGPLVKQLKTGDHVIFSRYSGTEMAGLRLMRETEVMAILE